jgi:hypothetical protein
LGGGGGGGGGKGGWMGGERCTLLVCLECDGVVDAHCYLYVVSLYGACNNVNGRAYELKLDSVATNVIDRWRLSIMLVF